MKYYTDVSHLTADDYIAAGNIAARLNNDHWLGCDVLKEDLKFDDAAVVIRYNGILFQVVLEGLLLQERA